MSHAYRRIAIAQIDVPTDRLRSIDHDRVSVLASDIKANGLLQPIGVVEEETGRFTLTFGLHRLTACDLRLGHNEIDARVTPHDQIGPQQRRIDEIMENLDREGLTMLERAESLAALKVLHEELYPQTKNGAQGGRGRRRNESEIFSFSKAAAEKTSLSRRAIEIAVSIVTRLDADVRTRLRGTWLEDHQAGLRLLSEQSAGKQHHICDLLFSTPPQATNVADAIVLADGGRLQSEREKRLQGLSQNFSRLPKPEQHAFFYLHESAIELWMAERDKGAA